LRGLHKRHNGKYTVEFPAHWLASSEATMEYYYVIIFYK
jgi:hypothetical protein